MISILLQHRRAAFAIGGVLFVLIAIVGFTERHSVRRMLRGDGMMQASQSVLAHPADDTTDVAAGAAGANSMDGITINDEGQPIAKGQQSFADFEAQHAAASKGQSFEGDHCKADCIKQQQGYAWARAHAVRNTSDCSRQPDELYTGCVVYAREQEGTAQDDQLKKDYLDMVENGLTSSPAGH